MSSTTQTRPPSVHDGETATLVRFSTSSASEADIRAFDFQFYFRQLYSDCGATGGEYPVSGLTILHHDFDGDGKEEAIVTGSSCHTGTAGPDIHAAFRLSNRNELQEIPIESPESGPYRKMFASMRGNRNYSFEIINGRLCSLFRDSPTPPHQVRVCYLLKNNRFKVVSAAKVQPNKTNAGR